MVLRKILFILLMMKNLSVEASGLDAYSSCYRTSRKRQELPCDFGSQTWCTVPGNSYPWHAVRRFVHENQGLMRRMYGDERHISVLRAELENNDLEFFNSPSIKEEFRRRYSKEMDGAKDFVKMFINSEGKRFAAETKAGRTTKVEKIPKSIEETSNNFLYQNHFKDAKEEFKTSTFSVGINKTALKTTTALPASTVETTSGLMTSDATLNNTTTETTNLFGLPEMATEPLVQTENSQYNLSSAGQSINESQSGEDLNYDGNTEEPQTTTNLDNLTTTETEIEEEEVQRNKGESFEDVKQVESETVEEEKVENFFMSQPSPPPQIRLKGINACPVKEEVVAPFGRTIQEEKFWPY